MLIFFTFFPAKVKNYNLNVTEVRDSDFKNAFPGIFNFTVGILIHIIQSVSANEIIQSASAKRKSEITESPPAMINELNDLEVDVMKSKLIDLLSTFKLELNKIKSCR